MSGQDHNNDSTYHDSKSSKDDIDQLKKELVADEDQHESDNYYTSLKAELDSKIPDRDYAEYVIRTIKRTVKQEDSLVRLIEYTAISKLIPSAKPGRRRREKDFRKSNRKQMNI